MKALIWATRVTGPTALTVSGSRLSGLYSSKKGAKASLCSVRVTAWAAQPRKSHSSPTRLLMLPVMGTPAASKRGVGPGSWVVPESSSVSE